MRKTITRGDLEEQEETCDNCTAVSIEFCLRNQCPYHVVKSYTDADRERYKQIRKNLL